MRGEVVIVPFPFLNLSGSKKRPALILIDLPGPDVVLAAISSTGNDPNAVALDAKDFQTGQLDHPSFIHPTKLFTFQKNVIGRVAGKITNTKWKEVISKIISLLN
jgi:mRNA interferase MazF